MSHTDCQVRNANNAEVIMSPNCHKNHRYLVSPTPRLKIQCKRKQKNVNKNVIKYFKCANASLNYYFPKAISSSNIANFFYVTDYKWKIELYKLTDRHTHNTSFNYHIKSTTDFNYQSILQTCSMREVILVQEGKRLNWISMCHSLDIS